MGKVTPGYFVAHSIVHVFFYLLPRLVRGVAVGIPKRIARLFVSGARLLLPRAWFPCPRGTDSDSDNSINNNSNNNNNNKKNKQPSFIAKFLFPEYDVDEREIRVITAADATHTNNTNSSNNNNTSNDSTVYDVEMLKQRQRLIRYRLGLEEFIDDEGASAAEAEEETKGGSSNDNDAITAADSRAQNQLSNNNTSKNSTPDNKNGKSKVKRIKNPYLHYTGPLYNRHVHTLLGGTRLPPKVTYERARLVSHEGQHINVDFAFPKPSFVTTQRNGSKKANTGNNTNSTSSNTNSKGAAAAAAAEDLYIKGVVVVIPGLLNSSSTNYVRQFCLDMTSNRVFLAGQRNKGKDTERSNNNNNSHDNNSHNGNKESATTTSNNNNGTDSKKASEEALYARRGRFVVCVINYRGFSTSKLEVPRLFSATFTEDIRHMLTRHLTREQLRERIQAHYDNTYNTINNNNNNSRSNNDNKNNENDNDKEKNSSPSKPSAAADVTSSSLSSPSPSSPPKVAVHIRESLPVLGVGFSLGGTILNKYVGEQGKALLEGGSHPCDTSGTNTNTNTNTNNNNSNNTNTNSNSSDANGTTTITTNNNQLTENGTHLDLAVSWNSPIDLNESDKTTDTWYYARLYEAAFAAGLRKYARHNADMLRRLPNVDSQFLFGVPPPPPTEGSGGAAATAAAGADNSNDNGSTNNNINDNNDNNSGNTTSIIGNNSTSDVGSKKEKKKEGKSGGGRGRRPRLGIDTITSIRKFDTYINAAHNGFATVDDYYRAGGSLPWLRYAAVPCVCVASAADPLAGPPLPDARWRAAAAENERQYRRWLGIEGGAGSSAAVPTPGTNTNDTTTINSNSHNVSDGVGNKEEKEKTTVKIKEEGCSSSGGGDMHAAAVTLSRGRVRPAVVEVVTPPAGHLGYVDTPLREWRGAPGPAAALLSRILNCAADRLEV